MSYSKRLIEVDLPISTQAAPGDTLDWRRFDDWFFAERLSVGAEEVVPHERQSGVSRSYVRDPLSISCDSAGSPRAGGLPTAPVEHS